MSKIQFVIILVTLVGVQFCSVHFFMSANGVCRSKISSLPDEYAESASKEKVNTEPVADSFIEENAGIERPSSMARIEERISEVAFQLEYLIGHVDELSIILVETNNVGKNIAENPALGDVEISVMYQKAVVEIDSISVTDDPRDYLRKQGEVLRIASKLPESERNELFKKLYSRQ